MKMVVSGLALASTALSTAAYAGDVGPYVSIDGGVVLSENQRFRSTDASGTFSAPSAHHNKAGWDAGGQVGYDFGPLRLEGDVNYELLHPSRAYLRSGTVYAPRLQGRTATFSALGNALAEFGPSHGPRFYAGGGIGWARTHQVSRIAPVGGAAGQDSGFAWQLIAGVDQPVSEHVSVGLRYRYFHPDADHFHNSAGRPEIVTLRTHTLFGTLTYHFGREGPGAG